MKQTRKTTSIKAFTMIEVLVTLVLSVVVMTLTLQVIGTLRPKVNTTPKHTTPYWIPPLLTQLERDLVNARSYETSKNKISLVTYCFIDPKTLSITYLSTEVTYEIKKQGKISSLSRKQRLIGKTNNDQSLNQLLALNVTSLSINQAENNDATADETTSETASEKTLPTSFKLELRYFENNKTHKLERTIIRQ